MKNYKYSLEKYQGINSRHLCPSCSHKSLSRYMDNVSKEYVGDSVGRCNREDQCGYHYTPKQYLNDNNISFDTKPEDEVVVARKARKETSFIDINIFDTSITIDEKENNFMIFLTKLFGKATASNLKRKYLIGSSNYWPGATIFWQLDMSNKIRTGKIMLYNPSTGKRVKEPYNHIQWMHKANNDVNYELRQCFFGEHLLHDTTKDVCIVESEKTAIIASMYYPNDIWLASGSLNGINFDKCKVLNGRNVTLYPDLSITKPGKISSYQKWVDKATQLSGLCSFKISTILEDMASKEQKSKGLDIADYLVEFDYKNYKK